MRFEDINKLFTAEMNEWIAKGYYINAGSMSGHQGEITKVDLTNGSEIIRINLDFESDVKYWQDLIVLSVGRDTDDVTPNKSSNNTMWTSHLEIIKETKFVVMNKYGHRRGDAWFIPYEELETIGNKQMERAKSHYNTQSYKDFNVEKYRTMAYRIAKKHRGCQNIRKSDIYAIKRAKHGYEIYLTVNEKCRMIPVNF